MTVTTGRKPKTPPTKKTIKSSNTEDNTFRDEGSYDSDEEKDYKLDEESEEEEEGDVSTVEPIIDGDDEVQDHQDVILVHKGRSKRGREADEADEADEAGGLHLRPRARPRYAGRYIPGM